MNCDEAMSFLESEVAPGGAAEKGKALDHIAACPACRDARYALAALAVERRRAIPGPRPDALQRAVRAAADAAVRPPAPARRPARAGFWLGTAVGAAAAAALAAVWVVVLEPGSPGAAVSATPSVSLALNETRDVNIAVDAPVAMADAEIHVVLTGAIGLAGFEGQKELRWRTDLAAGANQLTLPVVALGADGGQLLVEVQHGAKRRTFVVDVQARGAQAHAA